MKYMKYFNKSLQAVPYNVSVDYRAHYRFHIVDGNDLNRYNHKGKNNVASYIGTLVIEIAEKAYETSIYKNRPTQGFQLCSLQIAHMDLYLDIHT